MPALIGAGIAAGIAALIGLLVAPSAPVFSGAGLSLLNGSQTDPHLLTRGVWHAIAQSCSLSTHCIATWNVVAFAVLCGLVAYLAGYGIKARPIFAAGLGGTILATSPLAASIVLSAPGAETLATLALFGGIAAMAARLWNPPPAIRLLMVAALVLQDPFYFPAALGYTIIDRSRVALKGWSAAAVALTFGARIAAGSPTVWTLSHPAFDAWAAPSTIVLIGIALFGLLPFVLWLLRQDIDRGAGFERMNFFLPVVLGAIVTASAMISSSDGDPGSYWLAGEISLILGFAAAVRDGAALRARSAGVVLGVVAIAFQAYEYPRAAAAFPVAAISLESSDLWSGLRSAEASHTVVCVLGDQRARAAVLDDGAFVRMYHLPASQLRTPPTVNACLSSAPTGSQILAIGYPRPAEMSFALAQEARAASRSRYVLARQNGTVSPTRRTALPGGHGAYTSTLQTPLGPVPAFTVVAPFSYTFHCVQLKDPGVLSFAAANPLTGIPSTDVTRFSILLDTGRRQELLFSRDLPATHGVQNADWRFYTVPLAAIHCRSLTFSVSAPSGRGIGTWTTFAGVSLDRR
jgi:hypothetical protein